MPSKKTEKKTESKPKTPPLFTEGAGAMNKGMEVARVVFNKDTGMKQFEVYPGPAGLTFRLYDDKANHRDVYVSYDRLVKEVPAAPKK